MFCKDCGKKMILMLSGPNMNKYECTCGLKCTQEFNPKGLDMFTFTRNIRILPGEEGITG